jgi:hypothetical protein
VAVAAEVGDKELEWVVVRRVGLDRIDSVQRGVEDFVEAGQQIEEGVSKLVGQIGGCRFEVLNPGADARPEWSQEEPGR